MFHLGSSLDGGLSIVDFWMTVFDEGIFADLPPTANDVLVAGFVYFGSIKA
jgi:hypothetical protein